MNTSYWTVGDASKHTGKSKSTISKYIKNGTLSYLEKNDYSYKLDPSEVLRVFPARTSENSAVGQARTQVEGQEQQETNTVNQMLKERIAQLEAERERERKQLESQIEDLKNDRDQWRQQATGLLADKRQDDDAAVEAEKPPTGWLRKLFG